MAYRERPYVASYYVIRQWLPVAAAGLLLRRGGPVRWLFDYDVDGDAPHKPQRYSIAQLEDEGWIEWAVDAKANAYRARLTTTGEAALKKFCPELSEGNEEDTKA